MSEPLQAPYSAHSECVPLPAGLPHVAYVLLWYPLFTQPFIYRELEGLYRHLPLSVYCLYGPKLCHCSTEMLRQALPRTHFGSKSTGKLLWECLRQLCTHPLRLGRLFRKHVCRCWPSWEVFGENLWGFLVGVRLGRLFQEAGIDMVYAPWPRGAATAAWVAAELAGLPFALAVRGDNLEPADPDLADKLAAALFIRANNAADQKRIEAFMRTPAHVELVYNSLTLPLPAGQATQDQRLEKPPVRLLALGRFDVTKGFDVLLQACAILKQRAVPFRLTLAGGGGKVMGLGQLGQKLERLRQELALQDEVSMPGLISHNELPQLLAEHDIFVAPCVVDASGRRDGIPNTVIEALSQGLPVISTTVNALPEVVRHKDTGLAVEAGNATALAEAVIYMCEHPEEARRMGARGAILTREMFSADHNSLKFAHLIQGHYARQEKTCAG